LKARGEAKDKAEDSINRNRDFGDRVNL